MKKFHVLLHTIQHEAFPAFMWKLGHNSYLCKLIGVNINFDPELDVEPVYLPRIVATRQGNQLFAQVNFSETKALAVLLQAFWPFVQIQPISGHTSYEEKEEWTNN